MDELDDLVAQVRVNGLVPLPLEGWDQASIWGWDERASSLFADLWCNTDDPTQPPTIHIASDEFTPAITIPETLALHIAMAVNRSPWEVTSAMDEAEQDNEGDTMTGEGSTTVIMTEGHSLPDWPYRPHQW